MEKITVKNGIGLNLDVPVRNYSDRWDYGIKYLTKDCDSCLFFVDWTEAKPIAEHEGAEKRINLENDKFLGMCLAGCARKVLVEREKGPRKCEYDLSLRR